MVCSVIAVGLLRLDWRLALAARLARAALGGAVEEFVVASLSRLFLEAVSSACRAGLACGVANLH
jgi:hypothetical protein